MNFWILKPGGANIIFDTSSSHLFLRHVSSSISELIYISSLITTIKTNKIVSLLLEKLLNTPRVP